MATTTTVQFKVKCLDCKYRQRLATMDQAITNAQEHVEEHNSVYDAPHDVQITQVTLVEVADD